MPRAKKRTAEQMVSTFREAEVEISKGHTTAQDGLQVSQKQPKRRRLWRNHGSCIRLRPMHKDHVWRCDFVADRTSDGRTFHMLMIIDEQTRECLAIDVARTLKSEDILERLNDLFVCRGVPEYICSDNGPKFTVQNVCE